MARVRLLSGEGKVQVDDPDLRSEREQDAAEVIAAGLVGPERVRPARALPERPDVDRVVGIPRQVMREQPHDEEPGQQNQTRSGQSMPKEPPPGPHPVPLPLDGKVVLG